MDEALLAAWRATAYLVCLDAAQWPRIRIDEALPASLQMLVGEDCWGFITAWNPRSQPRCAAGNLMAQQTLLATLHAHPDLLTLRPGIGIGANGWYEPSLFVIGLGTPTLDALSAAHAQHAYVYGWGRDPARLRTLYD